MPSPPAVAGDGLVSSIQDVNDAKLSRGSFSTASLLRQLGVVFSFESTLVLFLFAGIYKEDPRFSWIPGDITLLAFGLSLVTGLYILVRRGAMLRRENMAIAILALLFVFWALLSYLWTPSIAYSARKIGLLCSLTLWPLVAFALIVSSERERVRRFFIVLVLVAYYIYFLRGRWQKFTGGTMIALYGLLMLGIGSRGPFLAMLASCMLIVIVNLHPARNLRQLNQQILAGLVVLTAIVATVFYYQTSGAELPHTLRRLEAAREEGFEGSTRFEGYATTWLMLDESPIVGRGIGSWPVLTGRGDIRSYPHNIFLEIMFELGMVGLLIFAAILIYTWRLIPRRDVLRREPWMMLAVAQLLSAFINANISGDLNDNKMFWAYVGLMAVCALRPLGAESSAPPLPETLDALS